MHTFHRLCRFSACSLIWYVSAMRLGHWANVALFSGCRSSNLPCTGDEFLVDLSLDLLDVSVIEALVPLYVGTTGVVEYEAVRVV